MSLIMGGEWKVTFPVMMVTFLAAAQQTNAQIYLLSYSDDRVSTKIVDSEKNITEVYTYNSSARVPSELSQTTMDAITIVWYVSTFFALVAFFFLMACSDRKCGRRNVTPTGDDQLEAPPTPAPSYSEFAPPSYETVIKKQLQPTVFVVQVPYIENEKDDKDPPPPFTFHSINELQKLS